MRRRRVEKQERTIAQNMGASFRELRLGAGLSEAEVAWRVGVPVEVYRAMEEGCELPSVLEMKRLCEVLRASSDALLRLGAAGRQRRARARAGRRGAERGAARAQPLQRRATARRAPWGLTLTEPQARALLGLLLTQLPRRVRV